MVGLRERAMRFGAGAGAALIIGVCAQSAQAMVPALSWSGAAKSGDWSAAANWKVSSSPFQEAPSASGTYSNLNLADLPTCDKPKPPKLACYSSDNNLSGITVGSINVDGFDPYDLTGVTLTLMDGLAVGPPYPASGYHGFPQFHLPISIGADQVWHVTGKTSDPGSGFLQMAGPVSGQHSLTVDLSKTSEVQFIKPVSTGALIINGKGYFSASAAVNANSSTTVTLQNGVDGVFNERNQTTGPLYAQTSTLAVGYGYTPEPKLHVLGLLDLYGTSTLQMHIDAPGKGKAAPVAGTDYAQINTDDGITLNGVRLDLSQGYLTNKPCPNLKKGNVYTLLSTSAGTVSGTFKGVPNGSVVKLTDQCDAATPVATAKITYTSTAVKATIENGGAAADLPTAVGDVKILGKPIVGHTLTGVVKRWTNHPTSFKYSWTLCPIHGGDCKEHKTPKPKLLLTKAMVGYLVSFGAVASNRHGQGYAFSNSSTTVVKT